MYNKKELLKKVQGHLKDNEIGRLRSIIEDLDNFNERGNQFVEVYVDYDDVGTDSEFDPYETFKMYIRPVNSDVAKKMEHPTESITLELNLDELDNCACALIEYQENKNKILEVIDKSLEEDNKNITHKIHELEKEGKIVYKDIDGLKVIKLDAFTKQGLDGQLYDLNRGPEVIYTLQNSDWKKYTQRWVNDIAMVNLLKYYYNKCQELEAKLNIAEDKNIVNSIIK